MKQPNSNTTSLMRNVSATIRHTTQHNVGDNTSQSDNFDSMRKLAGIYEYPTMREYDIREKHQHSFEKRVIEQKNNISPGTPEWFDLWFNNYYAINIPIGFRGRRK